MQSDELTRDLTMESEIIQTNADGGANNETCENIPILTPNTPMDFFSEMEQDLQVNLPVKLKEVLNNLGYNNKVAWKNFNPQDFEEIEREARDFLSQSDKSLENFKIFSGQRKVLLGISSREKNVKSNENRPQLEEERKCLTKKITNWLSTTTENTEFRDLVMSKIHTLQITTSLSCNENYACMG